MAPDTTDPPAPVLPAAVIGLVDLGRLIRELERLESVMQSEHIRLNQAEDTLSIPKLSALLDQIASDNHVDLTLKHNRDSLLEFLKLLRIEAPRIHVSFSADPSPQFMLKLIVWLRANIHPHLLVAVGLQPGIGAGCVLRTTNRYFDMSLGRTLAGKRELLMKKLHTQQAGVSQSNEPAEVSR